MAAAAGTVKAQFETPPGNTRTVYVNVKAEQVGEFTIHFSGYYWPDDNKDACSPVSLTYPVTVTAPSPDPTDSAPTDPSQIPETTEESGEAGGCSCSSTAKASAGELAVGWGLVGLCAGGGYVLFRKARRHPVGWPGTCPSGPVPVGKGSTEGGSHPLPRSVPVQPVGRSTFGS